MVARNVLFEVSDCRASRTAPARDRPKAQKSGKDFSGGFAGVVTALIADVERSALFGGG
jgi:hypothetical protein